MLFQQDKPQYIPRNMHTALMSFVMMTSSNGKIFCITGHLCGEFTGVRGIHRPPMNSPHKGQWHRALMFTHILLCSALLWFCVLLLIDYACILLYWFHCIYHINKISIYIVWISMVHYIATCIDEYVFLFIDIIVLIIYAIYIYVWINAFHYIFACIDVLCKPAIE